MNIANNGHIKKFLSILKNPWFTRFYLLFLLLGLLVYFYFQRDEFIRIISTCDPQMIMIAFIPLLITIGIINPYIHRICYKEQECTLSFWQAFRVLHLSRVGKYLPGMVWFVGNYFLFSKKLGINSENIAKNFIVINAILYIVGAVCCLPIISFFSPSFQKLLIAFPFLMIIAIHPTILNKMLSLLFGYKTVKYFRFIFLIKISLFYFIAYILSGISIYILVISFKYVPLSHLPLITAAAASFIISTLAIFAPAGVGVSEGISAAILSQIIPLEAAVIVVVAFRMLMVIIDFSFASISAFSLAKDEKSVDTSI